jgi:Putative prokaryotic signal transducing protein
VKFPKRYSIASMEPTEAELEPSSEHWVTVERFRDLSAAIVARSALEGSEIPCFLRDENTVRMDWQISNFIGGMRLQVREQDFEEASQALAGLAIDELPEDNYDPDVDRCPVCASDNLRREYRFGWLSLAMVLIFGIPAPQGKRHWRCKACRNQWIDE